MLMQAKERLNQALAKFIEGLAFASHQWITSACNHMDLVLEGGKRTVGKLLQRLMEQAAGA